ncbi:hypothetical protein C0995_013215 [Termitomyces sp. Mi166|nr:hypothetical protein C0995_013215 [Termitomyces sp. Mi166\
MPANVTPILVHGGIYKIINVASATVVTLSTLDRSSIEGSRDRNLPNQMWLAQSAGIDLWTLKNVYQPEGEVVYLSYVGNEPVNNLPLTASPNPRVWNITQTGTHGGAEYRIWFPNAPGRGSLADLAQSSRADGTVIQLYGNWDTANQFWLFQQAIIP